jgi:predicted MFS family arabinose efflux permease
MSTASTPALPRSTLLLLATSTGLSVANIYYNQPLLDSFRQSFPEQAHWVGAVPTLTQVGYAVGMLLTSPLGDRFERRSLIVLMVLCSCIAMAAAAVAPSLWVLCAASLALGLVGTIAQQLIPFTAELAPPAQRGQAVGTVMSGLLLGILLARTASGLIAAVAGWRMVFACAVGLMIVVGIAMHTKLPRSTPTSNLSYPKLLGSMWHLWRDLPLLREASLTGAALFAGFSAFWTTLALLLATPYFGYGPEAAGLFGLVGAAGALVAPFAGKSADRRGPRLGITVAIAISAASYIVFAFSATSLIGLVIGVILLDVGVQAAQISNQARIFALKPEARSRINTIYVVFYFAGGAVGSALGAYAWRLHGWLGVSVVGFGFTLLAAANHLPRGRPARSASSSSTSITRSNSSDLSKK